MKGAIDDLDGIIATLEGCGFGGRFYIHCDGALGGLMTPFIKQAPRVTFQKPIGSVSVSGHEFLGCPVPCGVVITRREHAAVLSSDVEYLSSRDATIMGSRNGHAAISLWHALNRKGHRGIRKEVQRCLSNAQWLLHRLREDAGVSAALMNPMSNTVVLERQPAGTRPSCAGGSSPARGPSRMSSSCPVSPWTRSNSSSRSSLPVEPTGIVETMVILSRASPKISGRRIACAVSITRSQERHKQSIHGGYLHWVITIILPIYCTRYMAPAAFMSWDSFVVINLEAKRSQVLSLYYYCRVTVTMVHRMYSCLS